MMGSHRAGALRVVAFGGGTGLSTLLRGLLWLGNRVDVTAIVAVTDDGGSTGRLRRELGVPAIGDLRRCLSAVATHDEWGPLLEHRFQSTSPLEGHSLGNLVLAAAYQRTGSLSESVGMLSRLLSARARVLPMTDASVGLSVRFADGRLAQGQSLLAKLPGPVERVSLVPEIVSPAPGVLEQIDAADLIVLGPGSLFSSVIASTLAAGIGRAIARSTAIKVLVQNLTEQRGETDGLGIADHVQAVQRHLGARSVDVVICHRWTGLPPSQGLSPESAALAKLGVREILSNVATDAGRGRLHDGRRLALTLLRLAIVRGSLRSRKSLAVR